MEREKSRKITSGAVGAIMTSLPEDHESLFSASFCNGDGESMVMEGQGSDGKILLQCLHKDICKADSTIQVTSLERPVSFKNRLISAETLRAGGQSRP